MPRYTIRKNRIACGKLNGFTLKEDGSLVSKKNELFHGVFLPVVDGTEDGASWGRLHFEAQVPEEAIVCAYALAVDNKDYLSEMAGCDIDSFLYGDDKDVPEKLGFFKRMGAKRFAGMDDCLLYELSGRYLYVAFEAAGEGQVTLSHIIVDSTGDNFMETYPEIYRERNSFFHRYISIFSSIYNDFQRGVETLPLILDLDLCTAEQLIIYGNWMGLDLKGGFLDEKVLRLLVKEAYSLNKMKGTRRALDRILEIILGEKAVIIEHNLVRSGQKDEDMSELLPNFKTRGVYDVTVLIKKHLTEELRHQILYILNQYKPVRTRIFIAQLDEIPAVDSTSYIGINTRLPEEKEAELDKEMSLDDIIVLT